MAFRTYKVPVTSVTLPYARLGPPAYDTPDLESNQGTNLDWADIELLHDAHADFVVNQGFFIRFPVPYTYAEGVRRLRIRYLTTVIVGAARFDASHEPYADTSIWDAVFSGTAVAVDSTVPGVASDLAEVLIDLEGTVWVAGNEAIIYLFREADHANDTALAPVKIISIDVILEEPDPERCQRDIAVPNATTIYYRSWVYKERKLIGFIAYAFTQNTVGTLDMDLINDATGNTMLAAPVDLNAIVNDTVTLVALTAVDADLLIPAGGKWHIELVASGLADATGVYFDAIFDDPE